MHARTQTSVFLWLQKLPRYCLGRSGCLKGEKGAVQGATVVLEWSHHVLLCSA